MMGNDWDLYAFVTSSAGAVSGASREGFLNDGSFPFPLLVDTRNEYHDPFDKAFYGRAQAHPRTAPSAAGGLGDKLPLVQSMQQRQLLMLNDHNKNNRVGCGRIPFPSQATRRSRKKQTKLQVRMKVEALSKDLRSWRKYGQKPIKGSPHPRSYYRCSSSKACAARKQVELSHDNPDEYIVSYIGDHNFPCPSARRSTAGTTRNPSPPCPVSPTTVTCLTPTNTPSIVPSPDEENQQNDADSTPEDDEEAYHEDDDIILIPNAQIAEDLFMAMHGFKSRESQSPANNTLNSGGN